MSSLLSQIHSPDELKKLERSQLKRLSEEIRQQIISVVSKNGGHLSSNLGAVDFTLALHTVFSSPQDTIIFDVSHQTYAHKLLTGRNDERFHRLRKSNGLSGFYSPKESPHDPFFSGHAATALSLALGTATSRDLSGGNDHVIAILGDGSLTSGLTFEALNNLPPLSRFIIILNDNELSISKNVGAISRLLDHHGNLARTFFEQFGLEYVGPINGHDIDELISVFESAKGLSSPLLIHLHTQKGYGLKESEENPISTHGVRGTLTKSNPALTTFSKLFGKHLLQMAERDSTVTAVTAATAVGSALEPFSQKFPHRFFDVGIAEGHSVTFAAGLAKDKKLKVVCSLYATFLQRAFDNLFHDICLQGFPVIFAIDRAGLSANDGPTHHGIYDIAFTKSLPQIVICQPRDGQLLKELMESSFAWNRPVVLRYPNLETTDANAPLSFRPLGKGEILEIGEELVIIALGHIVDIAKQVSALLKTEGITATIVDPIFVKPLDQPLLSHLFDTHTKVVTLEEHALLGGLGAEINSFIATHGYSSLEVLNLGLPDIFIEPKDYCDVMEDLGLTAEKITKRILSHFEFSKREPIHKLRNSL